MALTYLGASGSGATDGLVYERSGDGAEAPATAEAASDGVPSVEAQGHDNSATRRMRILAADDNEVNQMVAVVVGQFEVVTSGSAETSGRKSAGRTPRPTSHVTKLTHYRRGRDAPQRRLGIGRRAPGSILTLMH